MVNFVICEFNPFHNGHQYLLEKIGQYPTVCIMSGHITQRGSFAFTDKWTRARMALTGGADLVLELPAAAAAGSAMDFARGAMEVAEATGFEGRLCFGTEGDVVRKLGALARLPEATVAEQIKPYLKEGLSPAAALMRLYTAYLPDAVEILGKPNNLLAFEYLKANKKFSVLSVGRQGSAHDSDEPSGRFASASYLRAHPDHYRDYMPENIHALFRQAVHSGRFLDPARAALLMTAALRDIPAQKWEQMYPGGMGARLYKALCEQTELSAAADAAKTKCFTHAAVRRALLSAYLGGRQTAKTQFIRVLGMNDRGRALLGEMKPSLPVLIKPAKISQLGEEARQQFLFDCLITDRFTFMWRAPQKKGLEYSSPVIL